MMYRAILSILLIAIVCTTTLLSQISIGLTGGTAAAGETIDIDVTVSDFTNIVSMQFSINWDPDAFTYNSIENVTSDLEQFSEAGNVGTPPSAVAVSEGQITVSWNLDNTEPRSLADNTRLFSLRLNAGAACASSSIELSDTPRRIEVADESFTDIGAIASNSTISVDGTNCPDNGGDGGNNGGDGGDGGNNGGDGGNNGGGTTTFPDCSTTCSGSDDISLIVNCVAANPSATALCVPVTTTNFSNIASLQTGISWDPAELEFASVNEGALAGFTLNESLASEGTLRFLWIIGFSDDPVTVDDDGVLFEICFNVLADDGVSAEVELVDITNFDIELATGDGVTAASCVQTGRINIGDAGGTDGGGTDGGGTDGGGTDGGGTDGGGTDGGETDGGSNQGGTENTCADSSDASLIVQGGSVQANANTCVPVTAANWVNIASLQTAMRWDPAVLRFTGVNERTISGFTLNENEVDNGTLRFLWIIGFGDDPISPDDGAVLFEICFDGIGSNGATSDLEFVDIPNFSIELANNDGAAEQLCISQGRIGIGSGGGTDPNTGNGDGVNLCDGTSDVGLVIADFNNDIGDNVCLPVTTKNFTNIASIQTAIGWNSNVLSYTGLNEIGITGVSLNESETGSGELRFLWLIGLGETPVTLEDDAVLFELCFDVAGSNGESSSVSFESRQNFDIEISNGDGIAQATCIDNGFVGIGDIGGGDGDLSLNAQAVTGVDGQESCVDVSVQNFTDIQGAQLNIQWDSTFLTFSRFIDSEVLEGFGEGNFNQTSGNNLVITWSPVSPQSVTNNSIIATFCFNVSGSCDGTNASDISFVSTSSIPIEFIDANNMLLPVTINDGRIALDCGVMPPDTTNTGALSLGVGTTSTPNCPDDLTGSISVSAPVGAVSPVTCTWTNESGTVVSSSTDNCNLSNVLSGTYTLTATDATGAMGVRQYTIPRAPGPVITFDVTEAGCDVGGSINTNLAGGDFGPYTFEWAGGLDAIEDHTNLVSATYQLTITDRNNCQYVRTIPLGGSTNTGEALAINLVNQQDGTCDGGSRIEIEAVGGCSPYTYRWTGPNGETSNEEDIFRIAAGTWTVVATDSRGSAVSETYTIGTGVMQIEILETGTTRPTCENLTSGSIAVSIMGGCGNFIFQWNGPNGFRASSSTINNLEPGEYVLDVTDQSDAGIVATRSFVLTVEGNVDFNSTVTDAANREGNDGSINIDIPGGGIDTLSFMWSDGSTDLSRDSLTPGQYILTISDGTDCPTIFAAEVKWTAIFLDEVIVQTAISCFDLMDAVIGGDVIGGCEERIVRINGVETMLPAANLAPGTYEITADDACGTMVSKTIVIPEYQTFSIEPMVSCEDGANASIDITLVPTNGSGVFSVEWSDGTATDDPLVRTNVGSGPVTALVSDGCDQMEVTISANDISNACDGIEPPSGNFCNGRPIITPNGDGLNDEFVIDCNGSAPSSPNVLGLYDRWGRLVFRQNNYANTWSGTDLDGNLLPEGGYMWVLILGEGSNRSVERGTVTLLKSGN